MTGFEQKNARYKLGSRVFLEEETWNRQAWSDRFSEGKFGKFARDKL